MIKPRVSVIIPCYNQAHFLLDAVRSVFCACTHPVEIIIVDDGSTDSSCGSYFAAVEQLDSRVKIIHQRNGGLANARNTGIAAACGEFIQLLDADDLLGYRKIDHQLKQLCLNPAVKVSITNYLVCDESRSFFNEFGDSLRNYAFSLEDFLYQWERGLSIPIHCALFHRSVLEAIKFDERLSAKEDWFFWCKLACAKFKIALLDLHLVIYRRHESSMCADPEAMGRCWLNAAMKINELLPEGCEPMFLAKSTQWYNDFYAKLIAREPVVEVAKHDTEVVRRELIADPCLLQRAEKDSVNDLDVKISIVIPVYNHLQHLKRCILSALYQSYPPCEVICVNDASTERGVSKLLQSLAEENSLLHVITHQTNRGISVSQNEAVKIAKGDFIAFLDCDDFLHQEALAEVAKVLVKDTAADYLFTDRYHVDTENYLIDEVEYGGYPQLKEKGHYRALVDGMVASHLKVIRKDKYLEVGGCDQTLSGVQDWDLALKIAEVGNLEYIPKSLYYHRIHGASVTESQRVEQFRKTNVVRRHFQLVRFQKSQQESNLYQLPLKLVQELFEKRKDEEFCSQQRVILLESLIPLEELQGRWAAGSRIVYYLGSNTPFAAINFIREFNSYFDYVVCESPAHFASLLGYFWDDKALLGIEDLAKTDNSE